MDAHEHHSERFFHVEQMPNIGPGMRTTSRTGAGRVYWALVFFKHFISHVDATVRGKRGAMAGKPGGQNAVKHIHPSRHAV